MKKYNLKNCLFCKKIFQPTSGNQICCLDRKCKLKIRKNFRIKNKKDRYKKSKFPKYKKCLICNKKFSFDERRKFCSIECYKKSIKRKYKSHPYRSVKECLVCGKKYISTSSIQKYCSRKCGKSNNINLRKRFKIFKRDNFTCQYCGRKTPEVKLHIDHIIPKSKGGSYNEKNLITSCHLCNLGKSNIF